MNNGNEKIKTAPITNEEEIFKSLSHNTRRDIIRIIGNKKELSFTDIRKYLDSIDSPTLSYHLKSLQPLLNQKEAKYKLSDIGKAAYNLLQKTYQTQDALKYKNKLKNSYWITILCWFAAQFIVPLIYYSQYSNLIPTIVVIIASINFVIIGFMRRD